LAGMTLEKFRMLRYF